MLRQIESLLNLEANSLDNKEEGILAFKKAINKLREDSENIGAERTKQESYQAGERSTFKKIGNKLSEMGFEDVEYTNLLSYLDSDNFKSKFGSKEITEVDIKNSAIYKSAIKDLQAQIQDIENKKNEALKELTSFKTRSEKENILLPILSEYSTENKELVDLVKNSILERYDIDEEGNAIKGGSLLEDDIKNPIKFSNIAKSEIEKYLTKKEGKESPHQQSGYSSGEGNKVISNLSKYGITLPTNQSELSEAIRDSKLPIEFRKDLNKYRTMIEETFSED